MKTNRRPALAALLISFIQLSCGSDTKSSGQDANSPSRENGMTFAEDSNLPECNEGREGFLVFVKSTESFRTCTAGAWVEINIKGDKGDKGDIGTTGIDGKDAGDANIAINLYKKYKYSVFRVETGCVLKASPPAGCSGKPANAIFFGTAFLCGDKSVCTNAHVGSCQTCYDLTSLSLQAIEGDSDSVNSNGDDTAAAPFFSMNSNATIKLHGTKDLARFPITDNPPKAVPFTLSTKLTSEAITPLLPILSMSFPLGFQDLYADIGNVNTPKLGQCDAGDKYGCPADFYAFSTSNDTDHGSSGSPLVDISTGEVVGITTAGTEGENANYTWATDASLLKDIE